MNFILKNSLFLLKYIKFMNTVLLLLIKGIINYLFDIDINKNYHQLF